MKIFQEGMFKQVWGLVLTHLYAVIISTLLGMGIMWWVLDKPVWSKVFSAVCMLIYFSAVYSTAWNAAERDRKPYTTTKQYFFKGAVLSVGILAVNLILWLLCKFAWEFLSIDGALASYTAILYNVLFVFDTFIYTGFIRLSDGNMTWYGHIMIYLLPLAASFLGYIAGMRGFTLSDKLMPFIYEKRKND